MNFEQALKVYVTEARMCKKGRARAAARARARRKLNECDCGGSCGCEGGMGNQGAEQVHMIVNNMSRVSEQAAEIAQFMQQSGPAEEWVHEKVAAVSREIDNIYHYIQGLQRQQAPMMTTPAPTMMGSKGPMIMGDKPGAAPVGTYVFSTEKKQMDARNKKKGKVCTVCMKQLF